MKFVLMFLSLCTFAPAILLACPDFSGEFLAREQNSELTEIRTKITQDACKKMTLLSTEYVNGKKLQDLQPAFILFPDGIARTSEKPHRKSVVKTYFANENLISERETLLTGSDNSIVLNQRVVLTYSLNKDGGINFVTDFTDKKDSSNASVSETWQRL